MHALWHQRAHRAVHRRAHKESELVMSAFEWFLLAIAVVYFALALEFDCTDTTNGDKVVYSKQHWRLFLKKTVTPRG